MGGAHVASRPLGNRAVQGRTTMAHLHVITGAGNHAAALPIRRIGLADLKDALARGLDDFLAMPSHAVFLCLIYPVVGLLLGWLTFGYGLMSLLYPLIAGFALL